MILPSGPVRVRRKFYDIAEAGHAPIAEDALRRIAAIYAVEAELRGQDPTARSAGRQEHRLLPT